MKAALEAWGADSNLFHQGAARESDDPDVVAATMAKPGVVLKRPVGSTGTFREHAELPAKLGVGGKPKKEPRKPEGRKPKKDAGRPVDEAAERKAALAYERERKSREREQAKEEAARQKERERRQQAIDKVQAALDRAEAEHSDPAGDAHAFHASFSVILRCLLEYTMFEENLALLRTRHKNVQRDRQLLETSRQAPC